MSAIPVTEYRPAGRLLTAAAFAQTHLPRAKGAAPRWFGKAFGQKARFMVTRHGARLVMAPGAWDVYATMSLNGGSWDYNDFEWCLTGLPDAGVFYDIGANVGYFSVEMARKLGDAVTVIAFEPQEALAAVIAESARLNGMDNVTVVQAMAGDGARQADLYLAPASIHASAVADSGRGPTGVVRTRMITVDDLVESGEIPPPDLVKMDVEGGEHLVFRGARRTFRAHLPHIFFEYIAECDVEQRVRAQAEELLRECPELELFGHAANGFDSGRPYAWFRIREDADWLLCDSLFLKNVRRPVRDPLVFEPGTRHVPAVAEREAQGS